MKIIRKPEELYFLSPLSSIHCGPAGSCDRFKYLSKLIGNLENIHQNKYGGGLLAFNKKNNKAIFFISYVLHFFIHLCV